MDHLTWEVLFDSKSFEHRPEFSEVGRALQMQGRGGFGSGAEYVSQRQEWAWYI